MIPRLIGMVHLGALPGSPSFAGDLDAIINAAVVDAKTLTSAGFDALMVENFGDAPFFADDVPKITVAAMTAAVGAVAKAVEIPVGVNVLRNDAVAALAVAVATGAAMIRVNVLSGTMFTDQGPVVGRAAEVARMRSEIAPDVVVLADVFVKHATPPAGLSLEQAVGDLAERSGADAIVVSGTGTGAPTTMAEVKQVAAHSGGLPVLVGSGVDAATVGQYLETADGVIVGTSIKHGSDATNAVDAERARALVEAAAEGNR